MQIAAASRKCVSRELGSIRHGSGGNVNASSNSGKSTRSNSSGVDNSKKTNKPKLVHVIDISVDDACLATVVLVPIGQKERVARPRYV